LWENLSSLLPIASLTRIEKLLCCGGAIEVKSAVVMEERASEKKSVEKDEEVRLHFQRLEDELSVEERFVVHADLIMGMGAGVVGFDGIGHGG
jgi:hypothetical protein